MILTNVWQKMSNVRRLNKWYHRTKQSLEGSWVLREGVWYWVWKPGKEEAV
jgi:hypothetical protein